MSFMKSPLKVLLGAAAVLVAGSVGNVANALSLTSEQQTLFNSYIQEEGLAFTENALIEAKPNSLRLKNDVEPLEVYFVNEGAGRYRNQLLFSANNGPLQMIFEDVSSPDSIEPNANGPLTLGMGKSLGAFAAGTQIDFFLNSDGYRNDEDETNASRLLGADASENPDGEQHMVAYKLGEWVLLGFEDVIVGDKLTPDFDYNDVVFVIRGVTADSLDVPEPGMLLGLVGCGLWGLKRRLRSDCAPSQG
jgi:hypothetical protein